MREVLGDAKAIVSSTKKVGGPGTRLDLPAAPSLTSTRPTSEVISTRWKWASLILLVLMKFCLPW